MKALREALALPCAFAGGVYSARRDGLDGIIGSAGRVSSDMDRSNGLARRARGGCGSKRNDEVKKIMYAVINLSNYL